MNALIGTFLLLVMAMLCAPCLFSGSSGIAMAAQDAGTRSSRQDMLRERQKRLVLRSIDDLRWLMTLADTTEADLDREIDAITPLEPSVRGRDLRNLLDVVIRYGDWLEEMQAQFDDELALLSSGQPPLDEGWTQRYDAAAESFSAFDRQFSDMAARFDEEGRRLAKIIDRRRLLQDTLADLERQLAGQQRKPDGRGDKGRGSSEQESLRTRVRVVQDELLVLPLLDEVILKHYGNVGERARAEADWMLAKSEEYRALADITRVIMAPGQGDNRVLEASLARLRRLYERVIARMGKRVDALDRKIAQLTPAGSLHDLQRSSERGELYREQRQRYDDYIGRLKVQAGALEADLSELLSR